jgi:mannitol-specific phosphotransferase system IIBC component
LRVRKNWSLLKSICQSHKVTSRNGSYFDMIIGMVLGMVLGMVASPLMMKAIKSIKQRRRVYRMLHEISDLQKNGKLSYMDQIL